MTLGDPCDGELLSGQLDMLFQSLAMSMFLLMWLKRRVSQSLLVVIG